MRARSGIVTALAVLLLSLLLAACGDLEDEGEGNNSRGELTEGTTTTPNEPKPELPPRPSGIVQIDGQLDGSLTDAALLGFGREASRSGSAVTTNAARSDEASGFATLCSGETDLVDASRQITEQELALCVENGLQVVDFQIAFDATVVVTKNERDVGADCVNIDQIRGMFGAGSPITAWNQLNPNFFTLQLIPVGPDEGTSDFDLIGQRVLNDPDPTLASYRSDYASYATENKVKNAVAGKRIPPGVVGIVSFSFYELFEDKLRPLEIDGQTGDRCVFPSAETISSESYPLERTLRIYTTQRSLERQEVQQFLLFYLRGAEVFANDNELIPISDAVRKQQVQRLTDPDAYGETAEGAVSEPSPNGVLTTTASTTTSTTPTTTGGSSAPPTISTTTTAPTGSTSTTAPSTTSPTGSTTVPSETSTTP